MNIVRLTIKDIDNICTFDRLCFPNDSTKLKDWTDLLNDERTSVFAIFDKDIMKANISIYNWKGENDYIKVMFIGTHPDYRNKGYAKKLMQYTIDEMLKDNMNIFKGETRKSNLKMQRLFEAFNYSIEHEVENYYDKPTESAYRYLLKR